MHWVLEPSLHPTSEGGRRPGEGRFMESSLSFFRMHWDHEPDWHPSPCPLPARRGEGGRRPGEGRFMESSLSFFRMHWDHEPDWHPSPCPLPARRGEGGRRPGEGRFMESPLSFFRMHWDHEPDWHPSPCPLPARRGEGGRRPGEGRFMESPRDSRISHRGDEPRDCLQRGTRFQSVAPNRQAARPTLWRGGPLPMNPPVARAPTVFSELETLNRITLLLFLHAIPVLIVVTMFQRQFEKFVFFLLAAVGHNAARLESLRFFEQGGPLFFQRLGEPGFMVAVEIFLPLNPGLQTYSGGIERRFRPDHEVAVLARFQRADPLVDAQLFCRIERDELQRLLFRRAAVFHGLGCLEVESARKIGGIGVEGDNHAALAHEAAVVGDRVEIG